MISQEELQKRVAEIKKSNTVDLSIDEDLAIGVMNLISLEEHNFFNAEKTGKSEYFDMLREIREMRKDLLAKLIPRNEGETWCTCKHLLAATMRLMEVGTKLLGDGKNDEAKEMFDRGYKLFTMFWGLRLKLISLPDIKAEAEKEKPMTLQDIVNKMVDCCDE
jgi:hypothetical protein